MQNISPNFLKSSRAAFVGTSALTLADIRMRITSDTSLTPRQRRDLHSALSRLSKWSGLDLSRIRATAVELRSIFGNLSAVQIKTSEKTLANIKSLVSKALHNYGDPVLRANETTLSPVWIELRNQIPWEYVRIGLSRLMRFCSLMEIQPCQVDQAVLMGLFEALNAECVVKEPKTIIKTTVTAWNRCIRDLPNWPGIRLASPFKKDPMSLALEDFPQSFQSEVNEMLRRLRDPDLLEDSGPARGLRPATLNARLFDIRRFATALVRTNTLALEDISSIADMMTPAHFKAGVLFFLDRNGGKTSQNIHNLAKALRNIAKHHAGLSDPELEKLHNICRRIDPKDRGRLTTKNRERLRQFDDPRNKVLFLKFPETQFNKARKDKSPLKAARRVERALQVGLLMHCGVRLATLRALEHETDFSWQRAGYEGNCVLFVPDSKVKTHRDMESELPEYLANILSDFIQKHRPLLPRSESPYLFPGAKGGMRSSGTVRETLIRAFRKELGLSINPHLIRHALGKIVLERDPSAGLALSRTLGHASFDTTYASYLGTEGKAMGDHVDSIISDVKANPVGRPAL